jgi:hypothetical protein
MRNMSRNPNRNGDGNVMKSDIFEITFDILYRALEEKFVPGSLSTNEGRDLFFPILPD